ncbi:MAG TPA: hypothetical protein VHS59_05450, partial [Bacillota bacterium]|nr:hypothetical protein [Bacillota bacterium]
MMSLLKVIDNPVQDIPLAAVLRSGIVGLTGSDLGRIRLCATGESFYACVRSATDPESNLEPDLRERITAFLTRLGEWRTLA